MRCSCHVCDTYMVHSESLALGCVCPECGYRCRACLGTDTVVSRDNLKRLRDDPFLMRDVLSDLEAEDDNPPEDEWP